MKIYCAFTGHRPAKLPWSYDETAAGCVRLKQALTAQIKKLVKAGATDFMSGMALGSDIYCAEIVLALREKNDDLKLHCILPCRGQEDKWPPAAQERYHTILGKANSVYPVCQAYNSRCMVERDRFLVEHASILLAVYNGEPQGGTAFTVNFARELGREIIIIDPRTLAITHENPSKGRR